MSACIMRTPSLFTTVRINLMEVTPDEAIQRISDYLSKQYAYNNDYKVSVHPILRDLIVREGRGPNNNLTPEPLEIYVDTSAGCAIMRGANLYAAGILGSNRTFSVDDLASIWMIMIDHDVLQGRNDQYNGPKVFLGNGRMKCSRHQIFGKTKISGIGVSMEFPIFNGIRLSELSDENCFVLGQHLPSIVCSHVLECEPGQRVLDMCCAPGHKTTHLAALINDTGVLIAIDKSNDRLQGVQRLISKQGLKCVYAYVADAASIVDYSLPEGQLKIEPPFAVESFDRILCDAPCSGLGQRPLTRPVVISKNIRAIAAIQRRILATGVELLRPGGILVYSTCTLTTDENEANVRWLLDKFPFMQLSQQTPHLGMTAESSSLLSEHEANLIQKFNPTRLCTVHKDGLCLSGDFVPQLFDWTTTREVPLSLHEDTIGFFIAKFVKNKQQKVS